MFRYFPPIRGVSSLLYVNIRAHDDNMPHDLLMITTIEEIETPTSMAGIEDTGALYVFDSNCECIWKIDTYKNEVRKWLSELGDVISLSVTSDNHLLVLRSLEIYYIYLEIYNQKAKLLRRVSLPDHFSYASGAVHQANGEFIISDRVPMLSGMLVSSLSTDGNVVSKFTLEEISGWYYERYFFYSIKNYLFVSQKFSRHWYEIDEETQTEIRVQEIVVHSVWFCCDGKENQFIVVTETGVEMLKLHNNRNAEGINEYEAQ